MRKKTAAVLSLIFVMLVWGSSFTVTKVAVRTMPPICFAFLRFLVASIIMAIIVIANRKNISLRVPLANIFYMALTGVTFFYIFFNYSLMYTSASTGAMLEGFIPANIAIFAALFLKEKLSFQQMAGIVISLLGVVLVGIMAAPGDHASNPILGNGLMIICIICWSAYTILSKKVAALNPVIITAYISIIGTVTLLPFVFLELNGSQFPLPGVAEWVAIIYLGAVASALCYFLYNEAFDQLSAVQVGSFLNLDPVIGALLAVFFLGEEIRFWQIVGCVLVLAGVWLSNRRQKPELSI